MATEPLVEEIDEITVHVSADLVERIADVNEVGVVQVGENFACVLHGPGGTVTFLGDQP